MNAQASKRFVEDFLGLFGAEGLEFLTKLGVLRKIRPELVESWVCPALPPNLRDLIRQMARENPTWGEGKIADELSLKLGIRVSPRTVGKALSTSAAN